MDPAEYPAEYRLPVDPAEYPASIEPERLASIRQWIPPVSRQSSSPVLLNVEKGQYDPTGSDCVTATGNVC